MNPIVVIDDRRTGELIGKAAQAREWTSKDARPVVPVEVILQRAVRLLLGGLCPRRTVRTAKVSDVVSRISVHLEIVPENKIRKGLESPATYHSSKEAPHPWTRHLALF